ncbi:hypothetical protein QA640_35010 [Bradyrhizobium sp. CB82]|uniref:hypothetical protein n=1 Tax=Bradyrhizobium sp. CB82 TaxID=3039159 RepID=UPI0024B1D86E|nr:hypothetical protein [Bradyrhizobium sp. CB82]WFU39525.1 hypothetical protein QA640_35010 [Bradyrhizobium sp. CB82]
MIDKKRQGTFAGAAELVVHAEAATRYLKEMCEACANGDKAATRTALRQAISQLEIARALLRTGSD